MKNVRIWFKKDGECRYISHLDLNRTMLRALHKSKLPIWHTEGFNPHPFATFPLPLSLGFRGVNECMDVKLEDDNYSFKEIPKNTQVSYGGVFKSKNQMKIATIPIGYGDGVPRSLSEQGYVLVKGKKAKIIGRICMDHIMIDVSDNDEIKLEDTVTLIGKDKESEITVFDIEKLSGRFYYEIFCLLNKRLPRIYIKNNKATYVSDYYS